MFDLLQPAQHRLISEVVELLAAQIIVAAFHVADVQLTFGIRKQRLLEKGNVFVEELLLEIFGAGRNYHSLARADHRQQICQRLARARAGFNNQVTFFFESLFHGLRHLQLSAAEFVGRMGARK